MNGPFNRRRPAPIAVALVAGALACSSAPPPMTCQYDGTPEGVAQRPSPFDSVSVRVDSVELKLCYSRPSARGRVVFGELVPFDTLWRTGANEATVLHLSGDAEIAGIPVREGAVSLYTVPSLEQWQVVVNSTTGQWGLTVDAYGAEGTFFPNAYTAEVRAGELGRRPIPVDTIPHVEQLVARFSEPTADGVDLLVDWETTRVRIPIRVR